MPLDAALIESACMNGTPPPPPTAKPRLPSRGVCNTRQLDSLASLPVATDEEAGAWAPPELRFTAHEKATIARYAVELDRAQQALVAAEADLAEGLRLRRQLPDLQAAMTRAAADVIVAKGAAARERAQQAASRAAQARDEAVSLSQAIPELERRVEAAKEEQGSRRGALMTVIKEQRGHLQLRAVKAYEDAAFSLLKSLATLRAMSKSAYLGEAWGPVEAVLWTIAVPALRAKGSSVPVEEAMTGTVHLTRDGALLEHHTRLAGSRLKEDMDEALTGTPSN